MLKKLCLFQIIILTLRHKNKKLVSIMAKIERTYNQEKAKHILKHNVALLDYSLRELPLDAVLPSRTDKGMNYSVTPTLNSLFNLPFAFPVPFNHLTCGIRLKIPVAGVHEHVRLGVPIPIMGGT